MLWAPGLDCLVFNQKFACLIVYSAYLLTNNRVTPISTPHKTASVSLSLHPSLEYLLFICYLPRGSPYRNSLLCLISRSPCHFYLVAMTQQQHLLLAFFFIAAMSSPAYIHWKKFCTINDTFKRVIVHWDPNKLIHFNRYFDEDSWSHSRENNRLNVSIY